MWDNAPLLKKIANALFAFSALAVLYGAVHYIVHLPTLLPIRTVRLMNAPERVMPSEVLALVRIGVRGNFLTLDINRLRQSLEGLPWVKSVNIRREFPDGLDVQIEEHQAVAHWNDDELVDRQGEVFAAESDQALPRFIGIEGSSEEVLAEYEALEKKLAVLNLHVTQIALSARHAWQLHLDDGTVVELGREALDERMTRFVNYQLSKNAVEDATKKTGDAPHKAGQDSVVDMRYRNGFAVRMTGKA